MSEIHVTPISEVPPVSDDELEALRIQANQLMARITKATWEDYLDR